MKPWLRLESATHADPRVRKAGAGAVWPWVLCRLKDGDGFVELHDLDPWAAADACGIPEDMAARQLAGLRTVGLLVETPDGWTTPAWDKHQPDPTNSDRQKRFRERNARVRRDAEGEQSDGGQRCDTVTVTNGYVTSRNGSNARRDVTGQDMTSALPDGDLNPGSRSSPNTAGARVHEGAHEGMSHDNDDHDPIQGEQERRDRAAVRAAHERRVEMARGAVKPEAGPIHPEVAAAFRAWHRTHAGAAPLSSAVVDKMRRTIEHHGADVVVEALDAWTETSKGGEFAPVAWIAKVCERIADDREQAEQRAEQRAQWEAEAEERRRLQDERKAEESKFTPEQREANIKLVNGLFAQMDRMLSGRSPLASSTH